MKWLVSFLCKLLFGLALVVGLLALVFHAGIRPMTDAEVANAEAQQHRANALHPVQKQFAAELVLIPGIAEAQFIQADTLWVRFNPAVYDLKKDHVRVMCEGIARTWAARAQLDWARVEARYGNEAYALGTYRGPIPNLADGALPEVQPDGTLALPRERTPQEKVDDLTLIGLTLAEVEARHGRALERHASTGWAFWPQFKALFVAGHVKEAAPFTPVGNTVSR